MRKTARKQGRNRSWINETANILSRRLGSSSLLCFYCTLANESNYTPTDYWFLRPTSGLFTSTFFGLAFAFEVEETEPCCSDFRTNYRKKLPGKKQCNSTKQANFAERKKLNFLLPCGWKNHLEITDNNKRQKTDSAAFCSQSKYVRHQTIYHHGQNLLFCSRTVVVLAWYWFPDPTCVVSRTTRRFLPIIHST